MEVLSFRFALRWPMHLDRADLKRDSALVQRLFQGNPLKSSVKLHWKHENSLWTIFQSSNLSAHDAKKDVAMAIDPIEVTWDFANTPEDFAGTATWLFT